MPAIVWGLVCSPLPGQKLDFQRDVRPILMRCQPCHGPQQQMNGLRLDNGADAMRGGYSGAAIVPGSSTRSKLIALVSSQGKLVMPPVGPGLTESEVAVLRKWIDQGAAWPADLAPSPVRMARRSSHWSLRPVRKPIPPVVSSLKWVRNPIDRFVLARLDREGLAPSPEADKTTLLRRLHLDLTGIPPDLNELDAFLADWRSGAFERAVDRLLASPHYGEKWARQWLDLARYADSDGYE